jgi:oxygen-dependent protoporphyrinogen oxidase
VTLGIVAGLDPAKRAALEKVSYGPYVTCAFLTNEPRPQSWDALTTIGVLGKRIGFLVNQGGNQRKDADQAGGVLFAMVVTDAARELVEESDETIRSLLTEELLEILPGLDGYIKNVVIQRWPRGLPGASVGALEYDGERRRPAGRIHFAGDYLGPVPSLLAAADSGERAAGAVSELLESQEGGSAR